ncbi:MAG: M56 family metallopeptidase [Muribaculaceae bacterium]|nr:M56 family metallopeptidase [Roseburia sp.]MCM1429987.1 M56 family metallopeptidase [Muribaculaceae bacterium]MCM1492986.1 M56 family metallopeptidase [Muribaculaceae bacterium]
MEAFIFQLFRLSITGTWMIITVLIIRQLFRSAPKRIICLLWCLVGLRLILPFSLESRLGLLPAELPWSLMTESAFKQGNSPGSGQAVAGDSAANKQESHDQSQKQGAAISRNDNLMDEPLRTFTLSAKLFLVWFAGALVMFAYMILSGLRLRWQMGTAVHLKDNVWQSEYADSPFILGTVRPRIYLPYHLDEKTRELVLAHEQTHLRRRDHQAKPAAFLILGVHWFNPFVWLAYVLLCRDIELACDEAVIEGMDGEQKKAYSLALLDCSGKQRIFTICPVRFAEVGVKERIMRVKKYKKPAVWITGTAAAICVLAALCFFVTPKAQGGEANAILHEEQLSQALNDWANAFVGRDGSAIADLASPAAVEALKAEGLLYGEEGEPCSFGYSSPWPWNPQDYCIYWYDSSGAEIYYYAQTSDPSVTCWKETLTCDWDGENLVVTGETLKVFDNISTYEEFMDAYSLPIEGTAMDYTANGLSGFAPFRHLAEDITDPADAAVWLLNLSTDESLVQAAAGETAEDGSSMLVDITFLQDNSTVSVRMVPLDGYDGVWVPQF